MDKQLKDCNLKWAKNSGSKMIGHPQIRFVSKTTECDNDDSANTLSIYLNFNSSPEIIVKKGKLDI